MIICRLHQVKSALLTAQARTGLLGLEQDVWAMKTKNVLGDQLNETIPENVDAIHSMILDNRRIFTKKIAETLAISQ
jgi:hypothetical protein